MWEEDALCVCVYVWLIQNETKKSNGRFIDPRKVAGDATFKVGISTKFTQDGQTSYDRYADVIDSIVGSASETCNAVAALG